MRVMLLSLPKQQSSALTQLSVFPSTFDDEAAAAVMAVDEFRAHDVIKARVGGGCTACDASRCTFYDKVLQCTAWWWLSVTWSEKVHFSSSLLNLKPRDAFMYCNSVLLSCLADSSANQLHGGALMYYTNLLYWWVLPHCSSSNL